MASEIKNKKIDKKGKAKNYKEFDDKKLIVILGILAIIIIITISVLKQEKIVMTIDNTNYTNKDFNMYAYMVKYDYFGIDSTTLSKDVLNTNMASMENTTIGEYLKEKTISKIKISASILRIANENNITLDSEDLKYIEKQKEEFIERLGGESKFNKMLRENHTTIDCYNKVAQADRLYQKVFDTLYASGKRYDLSEEELTTFNNTYYEDYVKIKQIILLKKNLSTNTFYSDKELKQKETLAYTLVDKARNGENFDSLIKEYSDAYENEIKSEYYLKSSLVEELLNEVTKTQIGDISGVVSEENAYHVFIREELDDAKLNEYLDSKRSDKLIQNISDNLEKIAIQKGSYYEKIAVK